MPYAIRKVREEIVTEEMVETTRDSLDEHMMRCHYGPQVCPDCQKVWNEYRTASRTFRRQQRELADGTLTLETEGDAG